MTFTFNTLAVVDTRALDAEGRRWKTHHEPQRLAVGVQHVREGSERHHGPTHRILSLTIPRVHGNKCCDGVGWILVPRWNQSRAMRSKQATFTLLEVQTLKYTWFTLTFYRISVPSRDPCVWNLELSGKIGNNLRRQIFVEGDLPLTPSSLGLI